MSKMSPSVDFAAILAGIYFCVYTVDEREQVVITQFGRPIGETINEPGIQFKLPYRKATTFPKTLLEWDGEPDQIQIDGGQVVGD